ncbi:MAG: hypothetical protein OEV78_09170 [Spirochaetia bacterium]|nr:hypothetical protein [Spirochaetia bacterium]
MKKISFLILCGFLGIPSLSFAGASQASFTPTGYKYPIMKISITQAGGVGEQVLYQCAGTTSASCMVDVANPTALSAIGTAAANASIEAATYTTINLYTCPDGTPGTTNTSISVMGTVPATAVAGGPFSTDTNAAGGMIAGTTATFTDITWACSTKSITMTTPFVVTAGSTQNLTLLVDLTNSVWTDANASAGMGGCKADATAAQDICSVMPLVIPYFGSGTPTYERYLVAHINAGTALAVDANAGVNLAIDGNGSVFYAGTQPYFSASSIASTDALKGGPDYNASTRTLSTNADGTIAFQTGGSADNRVGFTAFQRTAVGATHTGTCKNELGTSPTWNYLATRQ